MNQRFLINMEHYTVTTLDADARNVEQLEQLTIEYKELKLKKRELIEQYNAHQLIGWRPYWAKDVGQWYHELTLEISENNRLRYENRMQRKKLKRERNKCTES